MSIIVWKCPHECHWGHPCRISSTSTSILTIIKKSHMFDNFDLFDFFQILISGLFVSFCQCKRLWPGLEARNNHKLFLVLFVSWSFSELYIKTHATFFFNRHFCMELKHFVRLWFMMIWINLMLKLYLHYWLFLLLSCLWSSTSKIWITKKKCLTFSYVICYCREPLKIWKLLFIPLMLLSLTVIIRPPIIFSSQLTPDSDPVRYGKSNF